MRLFVAINFNTETKDSLYTVIQGLKSHAAKGNFTSRDNLHLTLVFIGETARVEEAKHAVNSISAAPFTLGMGGFGCFPRQSGDIYWIGVAQNNTLFSIYNQLCSTLVKAGFAMERRAFKPQMTLGREVILHKDFIRDAFEKTIKPIKMEITKISLMKSERVSGKLIYTEIYSKELL